MRSQTYAKLATPTQHSYTPLSVQRMMLSHQFGRNMSNNHTTILKF